MDGHRRSGSDESDNGNATSGLFLVIDKEGVVLFDVAPDSVVFIAGQRVGGCRIAFVADFDRHPRIDA